MTVHSDTRLLRAVSRSFYLSLRVLPKPMRRPVSLAYLLARATDTLADTAAATASERICWLDGFVVEMGGGDDSWRRDLSKFAERQLHSGERALMGMLGELFSALRELDDEIRKMVMDTIRVIASGQRLDVERFDKTHQSLGNESELEDYCHRVAGCVGVFWTRIGFATLGRGFSMADSPELEHAGEEFGRGLQLVNILRDLHEDLGRGRCYLPVSDPSDREAVLREAAVWRERARARMEAGLLYAGAMRSRRLRIAVALPAMLGRETLKLLETADWDQLKAGVKITRATVRRCFWSAIWTEAK